MLSKVDIDPGPAYLSAVTEQVVAELLRRLKRELHHDLIASVRLSVGGVLAEEHCEVSAGAEPRDAQRGEVRIQFRETAIPQRYLFLADSLFERDERSPLFCGFLAEGDVRPSGGGLIAKFPTWEVKRETWRWDAWP